MSRSLAILAQIKAPKKKKQMKNFQISKQSHSIDKNNFKKHTNCIKDHFQVINNIFLLIKLTCNIMSSVLVARIGSGADAGAGAGVGLKTPEGSTYEAGAGSSFHRISKAGTLP